MRLVLLKEIPDDADLRRQWNALAQRVERPQVFYTYEWALAVYRAYRATLRPLLFLAYDGETLCGVAALATDSAGQRASFLCATTGDYCDFLGPREKRSPFVAAVLADLRKNGVTAMALANLPADSPTVTALRGAARPENYHYFARTGYVCAQVALASLERRGEDKPVLPRKKMLRRFLNAMGREHPVRLDHARSWDAIEPILPQFMQAHVARFLATGRISIMARAERRTFLAELARLLSEPGWLVLTRMMSGEKSFAWNYGFQFQDTWFWYQPTFDSSLEKYSPGFCLLARVIEDAADKPECQVVDLGLGAENYKERFANRTRTTLHVTLHTSAYAHYREIVRYRTASMVKASPKMEAGIRAWGARLKRVRARFQEQEAAGALRWLGGRLRDSLWTGMEVFFYEWRGPILPETGSLELRPLDLNHLALAVTEYVDDEETLAYLLRSAQRLRSGSAEGFVLVDSTGKALHFAWLTRFDGFFLSELNARVEASSSDAVMLFDCWTPLGLRGRGHYGQAIEMIAGKMDAQGKRPWIFSAATNIASVRGLAKAGFQRRYSLFRRKMLWRQTVTGQPPISNEVRAAEASARV